MASLLRILLELLRRLCLAKNYIKRFPSHWTSLLAYLVRKMGEWRFLWPSKPPGTVRSPKSAEPSFPSDRTVFSSVSGASVYTGGIGAYAVAASTVPTSANQPLDRDRDYPQPESDTSPPTPTPAPLSVDPPWAPGPSTTNQTFGCSHANHSSGNLSVQSRASDRLSMMISISHTPLRAPVQLENDRSSRDPRTTFRQFGPGPVASRSIGRSFPHIAPSKRVETASQNSHTASSVFALPEGRFLRLMNSDQIPRYSKNIPISREEKLRFVEPLTTTFSHFPDPFMQDCSPWIPATHPDGARYFYDPERRLFTDTDMHDPLSREEMEDFYCYLKEIERVELLTIPSNNYDMVLDLTLNEYNEMQWSYYYACHDTRCLFWLDKYDITYITSELDGVESPAHLRHRLEGLYWNHWSLFPVFLGGRSLPLSVYDELMEILAHGCIDVVTSSSSTLPYDDNQMQKMMKLLEKAKGSVSDAGGMEYYTAATASALSSFAYSRFANFLGQCRPTRLKRSALVLFLSPWLFFAPEIYLMEMERLWTGKIIAKRVWKSFMTKLLSEWNDIILWATVMLTVDVGFLAIPGVVPYNLQNGILTITPQMTILESLSEAFIIISLGASIGSTIIGLLLMRHNRIKQEVGPNDTWHYPFQISRRYFGLELLAIVFSLPWALLMWSMLMFYTALFCYCWSIPKHESRIAIVSVSGVLFIFFWACVWTIWESNEKWVVWRVGLPLPIARALRALRLSRLRHAAMPFRTNHIGSEHELADRRDGVQVVGDEA